MNVTIQFNTQLRGIAGTDEVSLDVPESSTVQDIVRSVVREQGDDLYSRLFNSSEELQPTVLLVHRNRRLEWNKPSPAEDGDVIRLMLPMAGG